VQNETNLGAKPIGSPLAFSREDNRNIAFAFRTLHSAFVELFSVFKDYSLYASVCGYEEIECKAIKEKDASGLRSTWSRAPSVSFPK